MSNNKSYAEQMDDVVKRILNRDKFEFDLNGDALYNQYKDAYVQQAKMAKEDAIGKASAMTGGYGNSYAQSVGQQTYQNEMNNLNDMVPELYQMALDRYNQEGQNLFDQYSVLQPLAEQELEQAAEYEYMMKQLDKYTPYKPKSGGIKTDETEIDGTLAKDETPGDSPGNPNSKNITNFKNKLNPESTHDAIARNMYGPYTAYVAVQIAKDTSLSEAEQEYLIGLYGITATDLKYARDKGYDI